PPGQETGALPRGRSLCIPPSGKHGGCEDLLVMATVGGTALICGSSATRQTIASTGHCQGWHFCVQFHQRGGRRTAEGRCMDRRVEFLRLFERRQAEIRAFIGSLIRDPHVREDLFQEVALVLWQEWERYDPQRSFGAWARGITANKIMQ